MNANFGILPPLSEKIKDKALKKQAYSERAINDIKLYKENLIWFSLEEQPLLV